MPRSRRRATKKPTSRKPPPAQTEEWYTIRRILDEKVVDGQVQYLVDWDDNIVTGEAYDPTWSVEVTESARQEWEETKAERARQEQQPLIPSVEDGDGSQPPRPANWRQLSRANASTLTRRRSASVSSSASSLVRPCKIRRLNNGGRPSEEPAPSFISTPSAATPSVETPPEVLEPFENQDSAIPQRAKSVVVEIPKDPNFDPTEYLSVINSQESGHSSHSLAELEDEDRRVAVTSHLSQGTIPDSQEVSDQSWSQFYVPGTQTSLVAPAENQPQTSQLSLGSCVIPDSTEQPLRTTSQPSTAVTNRQRTPSLSQLDSAYEAQGLISQGSETIESDIPSHQPNQLGATVSEAPELSNPVSHDTSAASSLSESIVPSRRAALEQTQSGASPVYLTQPPVSIIFNLPASSVNSQDLESPYRAAVEATPARDEQTATLSDQRESQAAQIVRRDFDSVDQRLSPSEPRQEDSAQVQVHQSASGSVFLQPEGVSEAPLTPSPFDRLLNPLPSSGSKRKFNSQTMEGSSEGGPSSKRRLTVAEELAAIFHMEPIYPENRNPSTSLETVPGDAPVTESRDNTSTSHTELPVRSPELNLGAQPLDVGMQPPTQDMTGNSQAAEGETAAPASRTSSRKSVAEELHEIFNYGLSVGGFPLLPHLPDRSQEVQQETVSLADITRQAEPAYKDIPLMPSAASQDPSLSRVFDSIDPIPVGQAQSEHDSTETSSIPQHESNLVEHVVTLPFQARIRPLYDETIMEYRSSIKEFSRIFSSEQYSEPDESLVSKVDELFSRLRNLCDYPEDMVGTVLEELTSTEQAKYCCDANPKFNFVFEFLQGVQQDTGILIVAGSPSLLRLLCHLAEALNIQFTCDATGRSNSPSTDSDARVVFALPTEDVDPSEFDVVISFDHSLDNSSIARRLAKSPSKKQQLVMILVTTHSIEHIDLHIPDELTNMERKSVLLSAIVRARKLVTDPDRGYPEPHEAAASFFDFLNGHVDAVLWEPESVPDDVLDVYIHSQARSQMPMDLPEEQENGRKRKLDDSGDSEVKRMRVHPEGNATCVADEPPLPDDVRALLQSAALTESSSRPEVLVKVPLSALEALARKFSEHERQINASSCDSEYQGVISGLEKRIKEYERTTRKVYESQRAALQDRSRYEVEKSKAEASMQAAVEQAKKEAEKAQKRILELESALARLTEDPNASDPRDTPLARTEKLLHEAQAKIGTLEKRLENAHNDEEYVRNLYQDASTSASAMKTENNELKRQNEELRKKSAASFTRIHEIQEQSTVQIYLGQIAELKAQAREREIELDRARDELRQLKNGRRETRQVSVPRSPRMGMMSPRTGRGYGGSASRGTSPASGAGIDGMQFIGQQPGNGRWNHLRD